MKYSQEIGMKEFYLKFNKLGELTAKALSKAIYVDEYLRVLDLSHNSFSEDCLREDLLPSLRHNNTITNLDLRDNPGYKMKIRKLSALCLLRNIDILKNKGV